MLRSVCDYFRPRHVVEIGSFQGASTMAFLGALGAQTIDRLTLVEPKPTPALFELLDSAPPDRVNLMRMRSSVQAVLELRPDLVFVDGDHEQQALFDVLHFIKVETPIIAMHDCFGTTPTPAWAWGCSEAAKRLALQYQLNLRDASPRPGERTERGLLIAFRTLPDTAREFIANMWAPLTTCPKAP